MSPLNLLPVGNGSQLSQTETATIPTKLQVQLTETTFNNLNNRPIVFDEHVKKPQHKQGN